MSDITVWVGNRIRSLRQSRGWTQESLAEYAELHVSYVATLEKGKKNASIEVISRISAAFGITLAEFFANTSPDTDAAPDPRQQRVESLLLEYTQRLLKEMEKS